MGSIHIGFKIKRELCSITKRTGIKLTVYI